MPMWYLSQGGEVSPEPLAEGRLLEMEEKGQLSFEAQLAMHGTENWLPAADVLAPIRAERDERHEVEREARSMRQVAQTAVRKKKRSAVLIVLSLGIFVVGFGILVLGLFTLSLLKIGAGVVTILLAAVVDRPSWLCDACGNRVEKSSLQCPTCGVRLTRKREAS